MDNVNIKSENMKINFGKGWIVIFYSMIMFWFLIGFSIDGLNIIAPAFSQKAGVEYADVLSTASYAGYIGLIAYIIIGRLAIRWGGSKISGIFLIIAGAAYIWWGKATTLTEFFIGLTLVTSCINGAAYIGGGNLITQWFPKKKGLANGFTTMGHNLGSALYVPLIAYLIASYGMAHGMIYTGAAAIIIGILGLIVIKSRPQDMGVYPDNVTKEIYEKEYFNAESEEVSIWTVSKLLRTKELWIVAIIIGINQLVTTGVMSQLVVRNMGLGFTQGEAVSLMTVCALIGVAGSYMFGYFDQKFGVKRAVIMFLVWYCIALAINVLDTKMAVYVSVAMIGIAIGAAANFMTSLPASVFGRHDFDKVYSVYFPIMNAILMLNYIVNATAIRITGSLRGAYIVFIIILAINILLINKIDTTKYNKDYIKEEIIKKEIDKKL